MNLWKERNTLQLCGRWLIQRLLNYPNGHIWIFSFSNIHSKTKKMYIQTKKDRLFLFSKWLVNHGTHYPRHTDMSTWPRFDPASFTKRGKKLLLVYEFMLWNAYSIETGYDALRENMSRQEKIKLLPYKNLNVLMHSHLTILFLFEFRHTAEIWF